MSLRNEKNHVDVRIDEPHKTALERLTKINGQKTAISTIRHLIRDAAMEAGVWPEPQLATNGTSQVAELEVM